MRLISKLLIALWMVVALPIAAQDNLYRCGSEYTNNRLQAEQRGCKLVAENSPPDDYTPFSHPVLIEPEDQGFFGPEYESLRIILLLLLPVGMVLSGRMILASRNRSRLSLPDDTAYEVIAKEVEAGQIEKGLWTRLFAENEGNEQKTRAAYIRERALKVWQAREGDETIHKGK